MFTSGLGDHLVAGTLPFTFHSVTLLCFSIALIAPEQLRRPRRHLGAAVDTILGYVVLPIIVGFCCWLLLLCFGFNVVRGINLLVSQANRFVNTLPLENLSTHHHGDGRGDLRARHNDDGHFLFGHRQHALGGGPPLSSTAAEPTLPARMLDTGHGVTIAHRHRH